MSSPQGPTIILYTDGPKFYSLSVKAAAHSGTLSDLLEDVPEGHSDPIPISEVSGDILAKIIAWMEATPFTPAGPSSTPAAGTSSTASRPQPAAESCTNACQASTVLTVFDEAFFRVSEEEMYKIIMAANFLNVTELLNRALLVVARLTVGKSAEAIRRCFDVADDFTEEERAEIEREMDWHNAEGRVL